ncbi:hypothetical protein Bbelb_156220 [Branchiostoma belcheri]|nr:hypothetical protein Bbelb_156220 [Branchiostoma belcheri]
MGYNQSLFVFIQLNLEGYTFGDELGHGASGTVYAVKSAVTGRTYAAKKLVIGDTSIREVSVLTHLKKHPNIMEFTESKLGRDGNTQVLFAISEFCPLGNIGDYILKQQVNVVTRRDLAVQLADAITFLHKNRIVHRDIKPQNVLLSGNEAFLVLKVVDFGLARVLSGPNNGADNLDRHYMQSTVGSMYYVAPEIYHGLVNGGQCRYTSSVDIFAVGLLLWAMFDGLSIPGTCGDDRYLTPFVGAETDPTPIARAVTEGNTAELRVMEHEVNSRCKTLVRRMLNRDPKERPSAKKVLMTFIREYGDYRVRKAAVRVDDDDNASCSSPSGIFWSIGCALCYLDKNQLFATLNARPRLGTIQPSAGEATSPDPRLNLEGYTFGDELGRGASGTVYAVKSAVTGRTNAAKKLVIGDTSIREVSVLTHLKKHPNIMEFTESKLGRDGNTQVLFAISEFCPLGNISDYILKQDVNVVTRRDLAVQLADAITFLHKNRIVHRDIKAQNVLLSGNEAFLVLKVVDFGLARVLSGPNNGADNLDRHYMQSTVGTTFYLAPEIYHGLVNGGQCRYTSSVDIFAVGLLLWAMFDGLSIPGTCGDDRYLTPFVGAETDPTPIARAVTEGNTELRVMEHEVNSRCKTLVRRMLNRDPKERPSAKKVLRTFIREYGDYRVRKAAVRVDDDDNASCSPSGIFWSIGCALCYLDKNQLFATFWKGKGILFILLAIVISLAVSLSFVRDYEPDDDDVTNVLTSPHATVTTRRTCFCVLSTCKNVGKRRASVRGEYCLRTESYGFGSTQTRRRTLSACKTFSACGLRIHHPCVRVRATRMPHTCRAEEARVSTASLR